MKAILWDGNKQLHGELVFSESQIRFEMTDFEETNLSFDIDYENVANVEYHRMYGEKLSGIEIITKAGEKNVFVVEEVTRAINMITNYLE